MFRGTMLVTLIFGVADAFAAAGFASWVPEIFNRLPLAEQQMGWLLPSSVVVLVLFVVDRYFARKAIQSLHS